MADHYFSAQPGSEHEDRHFVCEFEGKSLYFETDAGVFSKQHVDPGSELLCRTLPAELAGDVLDMGCGWGAMTVMMLSTHPGIRATMAEINERALELARKNVALNGMTAEAVLTDGFQQIRGQFDAVIMNPPIRAGKRVIYQMFTDAKAHLKPEGSLFLVIRKQQGAPSALSFLKEIYDSADVRTKEGGYWIIQCTQHAGEEGDEQRGV